MITKDEILGKSERFSRHFLPLDTQLSPFFAIISQYPLVPEPESRTFPPIRDLSLPPEAQEGSL